MRPLPATASVKDVRRQCGDVGLLLAAAGMIPPGKTELEPSRHRGRRYVAARLDGEWKVVLFQNTPAQFHGRPEEVERFTEDLQHPRGSLPSST